MAPGHRVEWDRVGRDGSFPPTENAGDELSRFGQAPCNDTAGGEPVRGSVLRKTTVAASSAPPNSGLVQVVVIGAVVALVILYRSIRTYQGRILSIARLVLFPILALLLWATAEAENALSLLGTWPGWTTVDIGLVVMAAVTTLPLAGRLLSVFQGPQGQWMYRYGIELIAIYLTIWVVRLVLAVYFDPVSLENPFGPAPAISSLATAAMQVVQVLFSVSTGLVVGRSVSTYRMYREALHHATPHSAPLV